MSAFDAPREVAGTWAERLRRWQLRASRAALQSHLRGAEKVLPVVLAALPVDRRYRAEWGFEQLVKALKGEADAG